MTLQNNYFSFSRLWALIIKEFNQLKRDHTTFAMILGIPIVQLTLFGLAINTNPKHLPTALIDQDHSAFSRTLVHELENTNYFKFNHFPKSEKEAATLMGTHQVVFALTIPSDFSRNLVRRNYPAALLEVDGTDPVSVAYAISASNVLMSRAFQYDLVGPLSGLNQAKGAAELRVHVRYNPSGITQYNIVPGLMGVILTMTMVMVTAMAITRERERGTMESLLITPVLPLEVIVGKVIPYFLVGYSQLALVFLLAVGLFHIPIRGSILLLLMVSFPFILANLFVGVTVSTIAKTQLEASQTSLFFFLPSMLLSGFAFPFQGMPFWAQWIGSVLPLTHFINMTRGIMLKGVGFFEIWPDIWPILVFMTVLLIVAVKRYRQTLD